MRKIELLAPAGSIEALRAAIFSGADAVYLGGSKFGARSYASNFNNEQFIDAIQFAHAHHVAIYVTVNTLIYDNEFKEALEYVDFLYKNQVDALIIQDFGLLNRIRALYPDLELHASTQMHIHNVDGVSALQALGVKRVVLARETSLSEIKRIHEANPLMELEVFTYGALCISYSGQCLFSSMIGERSGNRGECAQACRLPYNLISVSDEEEKVLATKGQYLLSPKDLNTINQIDQLIQANVVSLKIEGRMKRAEYVALVVDTYRIAIDNYLNNKPFKIDEIKEIELKKIFNRGFSVGHAFDAFNDTLMSQIRPNHQGVEVGKVMYIDKHRNRVGIKLSDDLAQKDGIRFLNENDEGFALNFLYKNDLLVNKASKGELVEIEYRNNESIIENGLVLKTTDTNLMQIINKKSNDLAKRYPLNLSFDLYVNKKACLHLTYKDINIAIESDKEADLALKTPLDETRVYEQLVKLKETPYYVESFVFNSDNHAIMGISSINNMRRAALEKLEEAVLNKYQRKNKTDDKVSLKRYMEHEKGLSALVYTKEQIEACIEGHIPLIFVYDTKLHEAYPVTILASKRVNEHDFKYAKAPLLCKEMGALWQVQQSGCDLYIDSEFNITNTYSALYYAHYKPKRMVLSPEMTMNRIFALNKQTKGVLPLEVIVYGRLELMLSKHCVINANTNSLDKKTCAKCKGKVKYYLEDRKKERYNVLGDQDCVSHVFSNRVIVALDLIEKMMENDIRYFRLNFTDENYAKTLEIVEAYQNALNHHVVNLDIDDGILGYLGK